VRTVLEVAPGAGGDIYARTITEQLSKQLGQAFVVENQPGAGGLLAAKTVSRANPDGYTLLFSSTSSLILRPYLVKNAGIDVNRDLTPITALWQAPSIILTPASLPVKTLKEFIDYAKAHPDAIAFGTTGVGSNHHFNAEQLQTYADIKLRHVPYKSSNESLMHMSEGLIQMVITNSGVALPGSRIAQQIQSGEVRLLAVVEGRSPLFPDVPAVSETIPEFSAVQNWLGLFAPPKMPQELVARLNAETCKALQSTEVKSNMKEAELLGESQAAFRTRIEGQQQNVRRIATAANLKIEG
jgi:tripartite-type tricarboxylate transporter receptor subunit TctC